MLQRQRHGAIFGCQQRLGLSFAIIASRRSAFRDRRALAQRKLRQVFCLMPLANPAVDIEQRSTPSEPQTRRSVSTNAGTTIDDNPPVQYRAHRKTACDLRMRSSRPF
jgi:hypothetical protein